MVREAAPGSESGFEVFGAKLSFGSKLATEQPDKIQMPINPRNTNDFKKWLLIFILDAICLINIRTLLILPSLIFTCVGIISKNPFESTN
jgi:hypothetical protein